MDQSGVQFLGAKDQIPGQTETVRSISVKLVVIVCSVWMVMFTFLLPFLSFFLNDFLGYLKILCNEPAANIVCGSGVNYAQLALALGRVDADGNPIGCRCEEGYLQDWACAENGFSISRFISTPPGTGAMAAFSWWPCLGMWYYGQGSSRFISIFSPFRGYAVIATLIVFQCFFGLFLINTVCIVKNIHFGMTFSFIGAAVVHYIILSLSLGISTVRGVSINTALWFGLFSAGSGLMFEVDETWMGQHAFWLGECFGLGSAFMITPILIIQDWLGVKYE